jgi:hypothetical protein
MAIKIDKNVPIGAGRDTKTSIIKQMNIGDSVFVSTRQEMASWRGAITSAGFKPVSRKEGNGYRIWKTAHPDRQ